MVPKCVRKLKEGEMTNFNEVPALWRAKVRKQLEADGYIINEDGTVTKVETPESEDLTEATK